MHWLRAEGRKLEFNWILVAKVSKGSPQVLVQPLFATIGKLNLAKVHLYIDRLFRVTLWVLFGKF